MIRKKSNQITDPLTTSMCFIYQEVNLYWHGLTTNTKYATLFEDTRNTLVQGATGHWANAVVVRN